MEFKVTLEVGLPSIKFSVRFIFCWPLLLNATTADLIRPDTSWMIIFWFSIWIVGVMKFFKIVSSRGREILQRYEHKFLPLYSFFESSTTLFMATTVSSEPMLLLEPLRSNFYYFAGWEDSPIIQAVIYFSIIFASFPLTMGEFMHSEIPGLLWFAKIRLELFAEKLMIPPALGNFDKCIEKLQKVLAVK